jgi:hypothetical protein
VREADLEAARLRSLLKLVRRKEPTIRQTGASVFDRDDATNFRLESFADVVKQVRQRAIIGCFFNSLTGGANITKLCEVGFERMHLVFYCESSATIPVFT